ncbi:uncharacterized protein GJ701_000590 [Geothlypis trichas]
MRRYENWFPCQKGHRQVLPAGQVGAGAELWEIQAKPGELSSLLGLVLHRNPALVLSLRLQAQEDDMAGNTLEDAEAISGRGMLLRIILSVGFNFNRLFPDVNASGNPAYHQVAAAKASPGLRVLSPVVVSLRKH